MSKIYLVLDKDDNNIEALYFDELAANAHAESLGRYYEVTEFITNDEIPMMSIPIINDNGENENV